jgi:hypothetical protein
MVRCGGLSRHKELVLPLHTSSSIRQVSLLVFKIYSSKSICTLEAVLYRSTVEALWYRKITSSR